MLRQIKMFRLDQATLDEVNTFLDELNESEAAEIDVQIVASSDANSAATTASPAAIASPTPYIAVFVVYTPKMGPKRLNVGLGPFA